MLRTVPGTERRNFINLFDSVAKRIPQATALIVNGQTISYANLQKMAWHYTQQLAQCMSRQTEGIVIYLPRSEELIATLLACHYLGVPYIPVDIRTASNRIEKILVAANYLLTYDSRVSQLGGADVTVFGSTPRNISKPLTSHKPSSEAYRIYTSGSTGEPKAVMVSHTGCSNLLNSFSRLLEATDEISWLSATSVSFDIFYLEYALPLANGGTMILLNDVQMRSAQVIAEQLMRWQPSIFQSTPSMCKCLLPYLQDTWHFNRLLVGGEKLGQSLSEQLLARAVWLYNVYGPTETTVWSTTHVITRAGDNRIGKPIDNTQIKILDDKYSEVASCESGKIFISGAGVAHGYFNNALLTAKKFVTLPDSYGKSRFYDTGDIGFIDAEDVLNYLYRDGDFYKINGYRIDCAEVVDALERCSGVTEAAVVVLENEKHEEAVMVAWLKMQGYQAQTIESEVLRQALELELNHYMIPRYFYFIEEMPYLISGKLDKKTLISQAEIKIKKELQDIFEKKNLPSSIK